MEVKGHAGRHTIQDAAVSGESKPALACSDSRSKPCSRQSSCSVTTTAAMHTLPWICNHCPLRCLPRHGSAWCRHTDLGLLLWSALVGTSQCDHV